MIIFQNYIDKKWAITYLRVYLGIDSSMRETISTSGIFSVLSSVRVEQSRLCLKKIFVKSKVFSIYC